MIFRQITHDDLGCASYLIGDADAGVAGVVDPGLEIGRYLALARFLGARIEHIFETHNHADHVSGHGRLAAATGAVLHIHREAKAEYAHEPFTDGEEWELGALTVRALHTPGHRPEHTAFVLVDTSRGPEPWAILTGDSLFVGDVARPDLAVEPADGARDMFHSLHRQLLGLPPDVEVWPGHLGGSMCGGPGMDMKISSTIGYEREHNPTLAIEDERVFVETALAKLGPQPPNLERIVAMNVGPLLDETVELAALAPRQVRAARDGGGLLVDLRADESFDEAHIPGAVSIPMIRAGFGTKLAWLTRPDQEIVFVGRDDEDGRRAGALACSVGLCRMTGFLAGGLTSWRLEDGELERISRIGIEELPGRAGEVQILDVRERAEWDAGHIPGSVLAPWHDIDGLPDGLDPARPIAVVCASGQRAGTAASLISPHAEHVIHVVGGGVPMWKRLGHPLET